MSINFFFRSSRFSSFFWPFFACFSRFFGKILTFFQGPLKNLISYLLTIRWSPERISKLNDVHIQNEWLSCFLCSESEILFFQEHLFQGFQGFSLEKVDFQGFQGHPPWFQGFQGPVDTLLKFGIHSGHSSFCHFSKKRRFLNGKVASFTG